MNRLLGTVDKNSNVRIEIRACELEGHPFLDIRQFWRTSPEEEWRPSKKGVTLKPELVGELIVVLRKAEGKGKA